MDRKILTLCMLVQDDKVLLGMKKRGFGIGRWNGFGGKVEEGETIEDAARREVKEEVGIDILNMEKRAIIEFVFEEDNNLNNKLMEVHIFISQEFSGTEVETEEMAPRWFDFDAVPYKEMWPDAQFWLPSFLSGKKIKGHFLYDKPSTKEYTSKILKHEIKEVQEL